MLPLQCIKHSAVHLYRQVCEAPVKPILASGPANGQDDWFVSCLATHNSSLSLSKSMEGDRDLVGCTAEVLAPTKVCQKPQQHDIICSMLLCHYLHIASIILMLQCPCKQSISTAKLKLLLELTSTMTVTMANGQVTQR